mgnify:FL=1|jgi:hypothetical protein
MSVFTKSNYKELIINVTNLGLNMPNIIVLFIYESNQKQIMEFFQRKSLEFKMITLFSLILLTTVLGIEGLDRIYKYENYEITTYERDGKERIQSIYLLNDMAKTEEDVKITDSYNKMIEKYSDNYVREENMYTYIQGKTALKFIVENNIITSIEYSLK